MSEFTFLSFEQVFGNKQLEILKRYGTKAAISDYAILLGGYVSNESFISTEKELKDRTGCYWLKTLNVLENANVIYFDGTCYQSYVENRRVGARPVICYSSISNNSPILRRFFEVEYGEYPQTKLNENDSEILEKLFLKNTINKTGKTYTSDSVSYQNYDIPFQERNHIEYEYNGRKYIRFVGDSICEGKILSDGTVVKINLPYWICVEPIIWIIDKKNNIALSKKILFSGIVFNYKKDYIRNFNKKTIKEYLDFYFSKEIVSSKRYNNYNFEKCKILRMGIKKH